MVIGPNGSDRGLIGKSLQFAARNLGLLATIGVASVLFVLGLALGTGLNPAVVVALLVGVLAAGIAFFTLRHGRIDPAQRIPLSRAIAAGIVGLVAVGIVIQAVPYGRAHTNPPVTAEPNWDSARTRELAVRACFDCHSNEVRYPGYASIAPFSWAVASHVAEGREKLNFSEWDRPQREADEAAETIEDGEMPPGYYLIAHADARLSDAEQRELAAGLDATLRRR